MKRNILPVMLAGFVFTLGSCTGSARLAGDRDSGLSDAGWTGHLLPGESASRLEPQSGETRLVADTTRLEVGPGAHLIRITDPELPLHVVALEFDLTREGNRLEMVLAHDVLDSGFEFVPDMARRKSREGELVIGALNADYFGIREPENPYTFLSNGMIQNGEIVMSGDRARSSFGMTGEGRPFIGKLLFDLQLELPDGLRIPIDGVNRARQDHSLMLYNHHIGKGTQTDASGVEWLLRPLGEVLLQQDNVFEVVRRVERAGNMNLPAGGFYVLSAGSDWFSKPSDPLGRLREGDRIRIRLSVELQTDPENGSVAASGVDISRPGGVSLVTGGGPRLLTDGRHSAEDFVDYEGFAESHSGRRHNRSAAGFSRDSTRIWLVAVDGRQPEFSRGATMAELAQIMRDLGAWNAVNLDGGGSTTLVVRERMVNRHDTLGTRRAVANALLAVNGDAFNQLADRILIRPVTSSDAEAAKRLEAVVVDRWGFELDVDPKEIVWSIGSPGNQEHRGKTFTLSSSEVSRSPVTVRYRGVTARVPAGRN